MKLLKQNQRQSDTQESLKIMGKENHSEQKNHPGKVHQTQTISMC